MEIRKVKVKANKILYILFLSTRMFSLTRRSYELFKANPFRKSRVQITRDKH